MTHSPYLVVIYCDDIRREEGNKVSYMGVYGTNLQVPQFPFVLPKLCFYLSLRFEPGVERPKSVAFRVLRDEEVISEVPLSPEIVEQGSTAVPASGEQMLAFDTVMGFYPFQLEKPCKFRGRAIVDGHEVKGTALTVELFPGAQSPEQTH